MKFDWSKKFIFHIQFLFIKYEWKIFMNCFEKLSSLKRSAIFENFFACIEDHRSTDFSIRSAASLTSLNLWLDGTKSFGPPELWTTGIQPDAIASTMDMPKGSFIDVWRKTLELSKIFFKWSLRTLVRIFTLSDSPNFFIRFNNEFNTFSESRRPTMVYVISLLVNLAMEGIISVSYTHLTLPTILLV